MTAHDLASDHASVTDTFAVRRYFRKFETITGHLGRVAAVMEREGTLSKVDVRAIGQFVRAMASTFRALSLKYLMTGRGTGLTTRALEIDRVESGFPTFTEILTMANDAQQARNHLNGMMDPAQLKDAMIRQIVGSLEIPTKLQFAMSQRLYYEALVDETLFWAQNDPRAQWLRDLPSGRKVFLLWWAVYDSQVNLPVIYLMDVEDSGSKALPVDDRRWPEVQRHLMAQSVGGLKLVTIASGFDQDFEDLHPKRLRRLRVGPMYSHVFTLQSGAMQQVLEQANAPAAEDWALAWTLESLRSERVERVSSGWFSKVDREIFALDPFSHHDGEAGGALVERAIIMPTRPYQMLAELAPSGFRQVRKFVVAPSGQVVSYR